MTNGPSSHDVKADKDGQVDQVDQVDQVGPDVEGGETGPRAAALPGPVSARPL